MDNKIDFEELASDIICAVDYDIWKDDQNEMDNELRNQIAYMLELRLAAHIKD